MRTLNSEKVEEHMIVGHMGCGYHGIVAGTLNWPAHPRPGGSPQHDPRGHRRIFVRSFNHKSLLQKLMCHLV